MYKPSAQQSPIDQSISMVTFEIPKTRIVNALNGDNPDYVIFDTNHMSIILFDALKEPDNSFSARVISRYSRLRNIKLNDTIVKALPIPKDFSKSNIHSGMTYSYVSSHWFVFETCGEMHAYE